MSEVIAFREAAHTITNGDILDSPEKYHFNPENYLINILRRAISNKQDISVSLPSGEKLTFLTTTGEYFSRVNDMAAFCRTDVHAFTLHVLSSQESNKILDSGTQGRNFEEMLWQAAYYASRGRLIKGCEWEDVVELSHWPNLTRLPSPDSAISIAALLTRYPTSIILASRILNIPLTEMFEFYSAAYSAGFITVHNRTFEPPELKPHRDTTMLGHLLAKIKSL